MAELEKVIRGLECCNSPNNHEDCPYNGEAHYNICTHKLLADAISLLKAQEARVMNYDELEDTMADRPVWYEGFLVGVPSLCIVLAKSSTEDAYRIVDFINEKPRLVRRMTYGSVWRCWTSRPTDEQREAVKWE